MDRLRTRGYTYRHDTINNLDVFTVPKGLLEDFDASFDGVQSNSLAVKILEHIIPYYYFEDWHVDVLLDSVIAHDVRDRHGSKLKSTEFVAAILGFDVKEKPGTQIDEVVRFKLNHPDKPVYISMSYGKPDVFGQFHGRHALRIKTIIKKDTGNHEFILVNPWDNSKTETFTLNDIKKRHPRFSEFSVSKSPVVDVKLDQDFPVKIKSPVKSPVSIDSIVKKTIDDAIRIKKSEIEDFTWIMAQEYVLKGILIYNFNKSPSYLTRSGNLRTLFTQITEYGLAELEKHYVVELKELPNLLQSTLELSLKDVSSSFVNDDERKNELLKCLKRFSKSNDLNDLNFSEGLRKIIALDVININELIKELNLQIDELDVQPQIINSDPITPQVVNKIDRRKTPDPFIEKRNYDEVDQIIKNAVTDKESTGFEHEEAKRLIYKGIINYVFYEQLNYLSRSGGLREFLLTTDTERSTKIRLLLDRIDYNNEVNLQNILNVSCEYITFMKSLSEKDSKAYLLSRLRDRRFVPEELPELFIYVLEHTDINIDKLVQKLELTTSPEPVDIIDKKLSEPVQPEVLNDEIIIPNSPEPVVVKRDDPTPQFLKKYDFIPLVKDQAINDNQLKRAKMVHEVEEILKKLSDDISNEKHGYYKKIALNIHKDLKEHLNEYRQSQSITTNHLQTNMKNTIDVHIQKLDEAPTLVKAFANFFIHFVNLVSSLFGSNSRIGLFRPAAYHAVKAFQNHAKIIESDENIMAENCIGNFS